MLDHCNFTGYDSFRVIGTANAVSIGMAAAVNRRSSALRRESRLCPVMNHLDFCKYFMRLYILYMFVNRLL
jgi:hypothetical protein